MGMRYGDKTRAGEPVGNAGKRATTGGGALNVYEQEFLSPGTWTWPGVCAFVEVLVVGGGGAGRTSAPPFVPNLKDCAGGGGVGVFSVPVSGPVPVTVGAGGTVSAYPQPLPLSVGGNGGTSAFGPTSPPIPSATVQVGGGIGADNGSAPFGPAIADSIRGGGQSGANFAFGGKYGTAGNTTPSPSNQGFGGGGGQQGSFGVYPDGYAVGFGTYGYGAGGVTESGLTIGSTRSGIPASYNVLYGNSAATAGRANTGAAGGTGSFPPAAPYPAPLMNGANGGSGIVIVRWYE